MAKIINIWTQDTYIDHSCKGDIGKKSAVALYMEAIVKLTKLKPGDINKEKNLSKQFQTAGPIIILVVYYVGIFLLII